MHKQVQICSSFFPLVLSPPPSRHWEGKRVTSGSYCLSTPIWLVPTSFLFRDLPKMVPLQNQARHLLLPPPANTSLGLYHACLLSFLDPALQIAAQRVAFLQTSHESVGPVSHQPNERVESRASCVNVFLLLLLPKALKVGDFLPPSPM